MFDYKLLSIDESGKAAYTHPSDLFILSGVIIPERYKARLDLLMRKLKKKYFDDENIIFHSRDMSRKKGPFSILRDSKKEMSFWSEFISIANNPEINLLFVIANKKNASNKNWQQSTILKRSYLKILNEFASRHLTDGNKGKILTESEPTQDKYLIEAHNSIQGTGTEDKSISAGEYRTRLTCVSLVNKANLDADVQMADALAPIAGFIYGLNNANSKNLTKVELMKKRLIERKLKNNTSCLGVLI